MKLHHRVDHVVDLLVGQLLVDRKADDLLHQPLSVGKRPGVELPVGRVLGQQQRVPDLGLDAALLEELPAARAGAET
jgi:hypothetical protein